MLLRGFSLLLLAVASAAAQPNPALDSTPDTRGFTFYDRGPYRPSVPRPESILGYEMGEMNTQYAKTVRASTSDDRS